MSGIILLGAGASVEADIPDAYKMTEVILDSFNYYNKDLEKVANFVVAGLLFQKGVQGKNPLKSRVDIEEFFNAILLLSDRSSIELAPFIGSWHSLIDELDKIQPSTWGSQLSLERSFENSFRPGYSLSHFSSEILKAIEKMQPKPGRGRIFRQISQYMKAMLHDLAWINFPERVNYLKPLINKADNNKLIIATLNYDNVIELASKSEGMICNTFINTWSESGKIIIQDDALNLLKLHGSIDWTWKPPEKYSRYQHLYKNVEQLSDEEMEKGNDNPAIIFGRTKLTTEGPFLDLLKTFQDSLYGAKILTVIGYSFRDDHINNYILHWLNKSDDHLMRIIDPAFEASDVDFFGYLKYIRQQSPERIEVICETTGKALLSLYNN